MKKHLHLLGVLLLFFSSCQQNDELKLNNVENTPPQLRSRGDGKYDLLGYGYDITDKYLDGSSSRASVIDIEKLASKNLITPAKIDETTYSHSSGTNVEDFSKNMSASLGLTTLSFTGSLNSNFKSSYKFNSKKSYAFYSLEFLKSSYTISTTINDLKSYLSTNFQKHIASATPEEIVTLYGTHFLTNVYTGARLEAFMETEATTEEKIATVDAKLGVTFAKLFGLTVNYAYNQSLATKTRESRLFYKTIGGTPELETGQFIDVDGTSFDQAKLNVTKWSSSINNSTPQFIKINKNSLIPIYELVSDNAKKIALKNYIDQYIKESQPESINNYSPAGGVRSIPVPFFENQGAGMTIADINKNGIPDMIFMTIDNPAKENSFHYKVMFDIDQYGNSNNQSELFTLGKLFTYENQGASISVTDLNKNGIPDMIFITADKITPSPIYYQVAYDVDKSGRPARLSNLIKLDALGWYYDGLGMDIYDFNNNGKPDMIYMVYDNPKGANNFAYKIGYDLDADGIVRGGFSQTYVVSGLGDEGQGAGVAIADINKNGIPDILLSVCDNPSGENKFKYKILWDVNSAGYSYQNPTIVTPTFDNMPIGWEHQGADCAIYDINKDGVLDLVLMALDNPKGANAWKYITGFNFTTNGNIQYWR